MKIIISIYIIFFSFFSIAQNKLPVIKATSKDVSIKDGIFFTKNAWTLSPETKPDVYTCDRTRDTKWVVFYTDIDSIKIKIKAGTVFNFVILLNAKDSCYTSVRSAVTTETNSKIKVSVPDTIPFNLTAHNAIAVKSVINGTDSVNLHLDIGSFDFRLTKQAILTKTTLLANQAEALAGKAIPDYNRMKKVAKIKIGNIIFNNPDVRPTGFTAHEMDGRFGWNLFDGKVVEIDYEKSLIIIHSQIPKLKSGFTKSNIEFTQSLVCINAEFLIQDKKYAGKFILDTGSDQAIILDSLWASRTHFPGNLKLLKTSSFRDPRGVSYESKIVLSPRIHINGFRLSNIPTYLLGGNNPVGFEINYFGNDLLKRFHVFLDFSKDEIYLKPNSLKNVAYLNAG